MHVCVCAYVHVCICACVHVCMCAWMCENVHPLLLYLFLVDVFYEGNYYCTNALLLFAMY